MVIKIVFLDFDQTLYSHFEKKIPDSTVEAIKHAQEKRIKIFEAEILDISGNPGEFKNIDGELVAFCREGAIRLVSIQPENGKKMTGKDYLRGHSL